MSAMGTLAAHLVEFGGDLHTHDGWVARTSSGAAVDGYRYARQAPCAGCEDSDCPGWFWQYVGPAFASEDAATVLADLIGSECGVCHETKPVAEWCHDHEDGAYAVCAPCLAEVRPTA